MFPWFRRMLRNTLRPARLPRPRGAGRRTLFVEPLESRVNPSTLIPVTDHRALPFDTARDALYVTTSHGSVQRFDLGSQTLLPAWSVGTSLNGADLTADGNYLYVAENQADAADVSASSTR
jgi:hypothetical protein